MNKKNIYLMYAIVFLQGMVFYGSIATLYRQARGVSVFQITAIESISLILCLVLELPWGVVADKIGYRRTLVICSALFFLSKIIFWQATSFVGFLVERMILSVVISGLSGVDTSILYLSCPKEKSQQVFGVYSSLSRAGLLAASLVFTVFLANNHKLSAFLTIVTYGAAAVLALFVTEVREADEAKERNANRELCGTLKGIFKNKPLLLFLLGAALLNETHQTITVFLNQLQFVKSGMSAQLIGVVFIAMNIVGLLSALSAKITRIVGARRLIQLCYGVAILACLALALTSSAVISIAGILVIRVVFALAQPLQTKLQSVQVTSTNRATTLSVFSIIMTSVGVSTNLMFGAAAEVNISFAFYGGAIFCVMGLLLTNRWAKKTECGFLV